MQIDRSSLPGLRISAVLNSGSGSFKPGWTAEITAILVEAGLAHAKVACVGPSAVEAALDAAVAGSDLLIVLGGDGTIRTAASKCRDCETALVPLPGGTMNMLPRALYGARPWREALKATLADPAVREVSGGLAQDKPFFCVAILGAPSLWADAREALRGGHLIEAAKRSVTAARRSGDSLDYRFGEDERGSAEAVSVICPAVSAALPFDARTLEAAALDPKTAAEMFRMAWHAAYDGWRRDPAVIDAKVKTVRVTGHGQVPAILDGEKMRMGRSVEVTFVPLAFRALVPADPVNAGKA